MGPLDFPSHETLIERKVKTDKPKNNGYGAGLSSGMLGFVSVNCMLVDEGSVMEGDRITGKVAEELPAFA